jgi:RNA polymerase sigma-70 factor (ECF subfamily)
MDQARRDDTALVAAARDGDLESFEVLVRAYTPVVYAHAYRFFGDGPSAEDAVQEVFIKVYKSLAGFDGRSTFSTWLYRVTRNVCLDAFRAGKRRPMPMDPLHAVPLGSADPANEATMNVAIEQAMSALPPEDRDALSAVSVFGLSYAEAGEALGVPAGTVKSRVFRARRSMAHALDLKPKGGAA